MFNCFNISSPSLTPYSRQKELDFKPTVWEESLFDKGKEKNTSDVAKMHAS